LHALQAITSLIISELEEMDSKSDTRRSRFRNQQKSKPFAGTCLQCLDIVAKMIDSFPEIVPANDQAERLCFRDGSKRLIWLATFLGQVHFTSLEKDEK
jgi:hypothetical protein